MPQGSGGPIEEFRYIERPQNFGRILARLITYFFFFVPRDFEIKFECNLQTVKIIIFSNSMDRVRGNRKPQFENNFVKKKGLVILYFEIRVTL